MKKYRLVYHLLTLCSALIVGLIFTTETVAQNSQPAAQELNWLTETERQWLAEHPVVRVSPTPHFPPFEYWEGSGDDSQFKGIVSSYIEHFQNELGIEFKMIRTETWLETLQKLKSREIDAVALLVPWTDRDYVKVSDPYITYPSVIIVKKSESGNLSLKDLAGKRVSVPDGYTGQKFLAQNHPEIIMVPAKDPADGIRMVSSGETDAFFGGAAVVAYLAEREGLTNIRIAGESDFRYQNGFGVRDDWGMLADIVSKTLSRITPAQKSAFHAEWVSDGFFQKRFYEYKKFWWILGSTIATMLVGTMAMVVWNRRQAAFIDELEIEQQRTELARKEAEAANDAKSAFVATISHEIRTPMNGVLGMCELLRGTGLDNRQSEYLEFAHGSAENLVGLINDILDFSKMEAGKLELEPQPFDLAKLLGDVVALMETQTKKSQTGDCSVQLLCEKSPAVSQCYVGDPLRIRQVLLNLISNAIKFTEKGHVKIKVDRDATPDAGESELIRFAVEDTGIGVAADKLDEIFEPFEQEQTSTTRRFGGTGLGLSICKTLAEMMGGTAFATSQQGKGSVFGFTAKLKPIDESALSIESVVADGVPARHCTVLLAEDGLVNQKVAIGLLESRGHAVQLVETGLAALIAMEQNTYDAVLMDIEMPGMDGLTAIKKLREREATTGNHQRVFAITGHGMKGDRERCLEAGMDGHLVKPFKPYELYAAVEQGTAKGEAVAFEKQKSTNMAGARTIPTQVSDQIVDREKALATTGGDEQLANELLETCLSESPKIVQQARDAVANQDFVTARRCGHSLASSFGAVGATVAAKEAQQLQDIPSDDESSFSQSIELIERALQELISFAQSTD